MKGFAFVAVFLVAAVSAGPTVPASQGIPKCAGHCKGGSKLKYDVGSTYVYQYAADTVTSVSGAGTEESRLHLSATVKIHVVSQCDFTMQLHDVSLKDSTPEAITRLDEFSSALERHALVFSFQDGAVDELCAASSDPVWVLNIKRGVLSAFQNSMKDLETERKLYEADVTGDCETEYKVISTDETSTVVGKWKNLVACAHRMDHFLSLQSTPYNSESHARSLPLVKSDHQCVQTFVKGQLTLATCEESHLFRPFSNGDSGAVTNVVQNLVLKRTEANGTPGRTSGKTTRTTLLFQHTTEVASTDSRAQTIVSTLEELEKKTHDGVQGDTPKVFSQLVATLRTTSYPTLAKVFSRTRQQHIRKFLLDAMPLVGTADGLTVMTDLYKSGEISDKEMDSWLTSLTFLKRPTVTMLLAISSLLDGQPHPKVVLGLSALVHSYCQTDRECHEKEPVQDYLGKMERLLGDGCHVKGRQDMELKIVALKGIGNMGVPPTSLKTITKCYMHSDNPLEVRLAAVGAHRRLPCASSWTSGLLNTYTDMQQDTELRIAAYLTVMQCPSVGTLAKIKDTLYSEEVNQVASFVWTHLTNIQETSSRWKQSIRDLISSDFLQNKFHTDARKFSRNYEGSLFLDSLNAGATVDSNVIFTPQSYLPRSVSLNLTLDLFGESINVFEIGSRAEGFEQIVEDMFGPGGYFPDKSMKKVLQNARGKRDEDLENSIDQLSKIFDANSKLNVEPQASIYARVFGNEIHYSRYQGLGDLTGGHPHLDNPLAILSKLLGGQDVDYTNSFVFLDASYRFPTVAGLSLELAVNGSATVGLKASGHMDLSHSSIDLRGRIAPSAAVRVVGSMVVDGVVTKAGLRSVSSLHTNTYLDGQATIRGRSLVDVKLNVPREKVEILEVTSQMFVLRREEDLEVAGVVEDREVSSGCSSETVSQVFGMKLCGEMAYPNASLSRRAPHFPLTGPVTLRIDLIKTDVFDAYELNYQQQSLADGNVRMLKLHLDTPKSRIDRNIETLLTLDRKNVVVKGELKTPFIKLDASGKLDLSENSRAADLTVHMNDETLFSTKAAIKVSHNNKVSRYEPSLSLVVHNLVDMDLVGKVNYIEGTKYNADFTMSGLTNKPLLFSADLNCDGGKYDMVGSIRSPLVEGSIHANLRQTNSYVNTKVTVDYSVRGGRPESVNLSAKIQSSSKRALQKNSAYGSLQISALPEYNLLMRLDRLRSDNYLEYNGRFGLGKTEWQTKQLYRFHAHGSDDINFALLCHLTCPSKNVDYKAEVQYKTTDSSIATHALAQINPQHKFYTALNFLRLDERQGFTVELSCPWYMTSLKGEVVESEPGLFNTKMEGRYEVLGRNGVSKVQSLSVHSTYIDGSTDIQLERKLLVEMSGVLAAKLEGEVKSDAGSSSLWTQLDVRGNKYRTDVAYTRNSVTSHVVHVTVLLVDRKYYGTVGLQHSDIETAFSVDLQLSRRLALATKTFNDGVTQGVEFELMWDKDLDPSRRISLMVHSNNVKREALLEFPGQYIKGELVTLPKSVGGLLEWAEDQKITMNAEWNVERDGARATARFTTPFSGIETQSITASYKYNETVMQLETDVAWQHEKVTLTVAGVRKNHRHPTNVDGDKKIAFTTFEVEAAVTSTIKSLDDISASYEHQQFEMSQRKSISVLCGRKTIFSGSLMSKSSEFKTDLYFDSPFKMLPSVQGNLSRVHISGQGCNCSLQLNVGLDNKLAAGVVFNRDSGLTGMLQVITPFDSFKNTSAKFAYRKDGADVNLMADIELDKKLTSLTVSSSKTSSIILGSGSLITPFMKPFEAGFTHSLEQGYLKEGISVSSDGQHLLLASLVGGFHTWKSFKLTTDVTLPSHSIITNVENRLEAESMKTKFEVDWNGDRLGSSLSITNREVSFSAATFNSFASLETQILFTHKFEPGVSYSTSFILPGYVDMLHVFNIRDFVNWQNEFLFKTPMNNGRIFNKQSFNYDHLEFAHNITVDWNAPKAAVNVAFTLDRPSNLITKAEAALTTHWSQPMRLIFNMPLTRSTISPRLALQYEDTKEIVVASEVQLDPMRVKVQLDVTSPFCKPVSLNAFYEMTYRNLVAEVSVQWEDKRMDAETSLQNLFSEHASGVLTVTRSDVMGDIVHARFEYDVAQISAMSGHLSAGYKDTTVDVSLSGAMSNADFKGNCVVTTPFSNWERLAASLNIDASKTSRRGVLTIDRNEDSVSFSGATQETGPLELRVALISNVPSVPDASLSATFDDKPENRVLTLLGKYREHKVQLKAAVQTGKEVGLFEVALQTSFSGLENLLSRVSFNGKPGDKSLGVVLVKNDFKVQVDANCLRKDNSTREVTLVLHSPFTGLEKVSASLHILTLEGKQDERTTASLIILTRNDEVVEVATTVRTAMDELTVIVNCKTPVNEFKALSAEILIMHTEKQKSIVVSLMKNDAHLRANAVLKMDGYFNAEGSFQMITPFQDYESLSAGFDYNWPDSFLADRDGKTVQGKAKIYLEILNDTNEIQMEINYLPSSYKSDIKASVMLPIMAMKTVNIEAKLDVKQQRVDLQGKLNDEFVNVHAELLRNSIDSSILSSISGYEKIILTGVVKQSTDKRVATISFAKNDAEFVTSMTVLLNSLTSELHVVSTTPISNWQRLNVDVKFDKARSKKTLEFSFSKMDEQYTAAAEWLSGVKIAEYNAVLSTPIRGLRSLKLHASYDISKHFAAKALLQTDLHKIEGSVIATDKEIKIVIETPVEQIRNVAVVGSYSFLGSTKYAVFQLERNKDKVNFDIKFTTDKESNELTINTPFNSCGTISVLFSHSGLLTDKNKSLSLAVLKNSEKLFDISGEVDLDWESRIGLNFNAMLPFLTSEFQEVGVEAWFVTEHTQKTIIFHVRRNLVSVFELKTNIVFVQEDGLTYVMKVDGKVFDYSRQELEYELHSKDNSVKSAIGLVNNNGKDKYSAQFAVDNTTFKFDFSSPIVRHENLSVHLKKTQDSVSVDFTTSFFDYDMVKLSGKLSAKNRFENSMSFSAIKDQERIEVDLKLQYDALYAKTSFDLTSPLDYYKNLNFKGEYNLHNERKTATLVFVRNTRSVKIAGDMLLKDMLLSKSTINITAPDDKLFGSIDISQPSINNVTFFILLNDIPQVRVTFNVESSLNKGKVALVLLIPFNGISFVATGSFDVSDPSKIVSVEGVLAGLDVIVNVSAAIRDNLKYGELHSAFGKGKILHEGKISWYLENELKQKKAKVIIDLGDKRVVEANALVNMNGLNDMKTLLNFTDNSFRSYVIIADWNVAKNKAECKFGYEWSRQQIYFESLFERAGSEFTTNMKFASPYKNFEDISFQSKSSFGNSFALDNSIQWAKSKKVVLNILYRSLLPRQLEVKFESPYTAPLVCSLSHLSTEPPSELHAELLASFSYGSWKNELNAKFDIGDNIEIDLTVVTPMPGIRTLHLNGKLKSNVTKHEAFLLLEKENQKWRFFGTVLQKENKADVVVSLTTPVSSFQQAKLLVSYDLSNGYSGVVSFQMNEQMLLSGSLKLLSSGGMLEVKTPWKGFEVVSAECWLEVNGGVTQLQAQSNFRGNKAELKAMVKMENEKKILTELQLKSPWTRDFSLDGLYNKEEKHTMKITVRQGEKVTEILGTLGYVTVDSRMEIEFDSLVEGLGSMSAKAGFNWKGQQKTALLSVRLGEVEFHARAQGKVSREGLSGDLRIETPIDGLKKVEVKIQLEKTGSVTMLVDDKTYQLHYVALYSAGSIGGQVSLSSPNFELEKVAFSVKFGKNFFNFNGEVEGEKVDFISSYKFDALKTYFNARLQAPVIKSLRDIEVNVDLDMAKSDLSSMIQWSPEEKINVALKFGAHNYQLNVKTPFTNVRDLDLSYHVVLKENDYNVVSRADWDGLKVDFDGTAQLFDTLNVNLNLQSEWGEGQTATMRTTLTTTKDNVHVHILGSVYGREINIVAEIDNIRSSNITAKVNLQIPFAPMYVEANLSKDTWKACDVNVRFSLPGGVVHKVTANYGLKGGDFKAGFDMDFPFIKSKLDMGGSFTNNNFTSMETNVYVNTNKLSASYEILNKVFIGAVDLNIPDLGISNTRVDVQTSLAFNPDIQGSLTYRQGVYRGSVTGSLMKSNMAFSSQIDFVLPEVESHAATPACTVKASANFLGSRKFVEVELNDGRWTRFASLEVDRSGSDLSVKGRYVGPFLGDKEISFHMQNNMQLIVVHVTDVIRLELKNDVNSGSGTVKYANKEHKLSYQVSRIRSNLEASMTLESLLLKSGKINVRVTSETKDKNILTALKCTVGSVTNEAVVQLTNEEKLKAFSFKLVKASENYLNVDVSSALNDKYVKNEASFKWATSLNTVSLQYNPTWPIDVQFSMRSPHLPDNLVEVKLSIQESLVTAYAGLGEMRLKRFVSLIADYDINKRTANFEFQAPFCYFVNTLTLNGVFKASNEIVHLSFDGYFSSKIHSDSQLSTKFILSKAGIDSAFNIKTPLTNLKNFEIIVQVPFIFSKQYDSNLLMSLPSGIKYAAHARMHRLSDAFELAFGAEYGTEKLNVALKLAQKPVVTVDLVLDTPLKNFKHYQLQLRGQRSLVEGDDVLNFVEWNDQRIELRHSTVSSDNKMDYRVQLLTPFVRYERFVAGVQYEFAARKKFLVILGLPGMDEDWKIEFDFFLNNILDSSFLVDVRFPIFSGFKSASHLFSSKYDEETRKYRMVVSGNYNQHELVVTVDGNLKGSVALVDVKAQMNTYKVNALFTYGITSIGMISSTFEIDTPFSLVKSGKASLLMFGRPNTLIHANVTLNSNQLLFLNVYEDDNNIIRIEAINPWRSMSLGYSDYFRKSSSVWGEICWDLNNKATSQFGGGVLLSEVPNSKRQALLSVILPTRIVSLNYTRRYSTSMLEYEASFSWQHEQSVGYRVLYEYDSEFKWSALARLDLPFRAFEVSSHVDVAVVAHGDLGAQFMWDAAGDRSKRMGLGVTWTPDNAELALQHAALKHNIAIRVEQENYITQNPDKLYTTKVIVEYSPLPQDLFIIGTFYRGTSGQNTGVETLFLVRHDASNLDHSILFSTSKTPEHNAVKIGVNYKNSRSAETQKLEIYAKLGTIHPDIEVSLLDSNNRLSVKGSLWSKENGYRGFNALLTMNHKEPLRLEGQINLAEKSVELDMSYGSSRGYTLRAGMPTSRLVSAGITRTLYGLPSADVQVTLKLNTSRLLWTQVRWNPRVFEEIQQYLFQEYADVSVVAQNIVDSFSRVFDEDVLANLLTACSDICSDVFADFGPYTEREIQLIGEDFAEIIETAKYMYRRNSFYSKDIHQLLNGTMSYIQEKGSCLVKKILEAVVALHKCVKQFYVFAAEVFSVNFAEISNYLKELQAYGKIAFEHVVRVMIELNNLGEALRTTAKNLLTTIRQGIADVDRMAVGMIVDVEGYVDDKVRKVSIALRPHMVTMQGYFIVLHNSLSAIQHSINEMVQTVFSTIMAVKEVRELVALYDEYSGWLEEFKVQHYLDGIFLYLNTVGEIMVDDFHRMFAEYETPIYATLNLMNGQLEKFDRVPAVAYTKHVFNTVLEKVSWAWRYHDLSKNLELLAQTIFNNLDEIVVQLLHRVDTAPDPSLRHGRHLVVRPGFLEISQRLPVDWESFEQWPEFSQLTTSTSKDIAGVDGYHSRMTAALAQLTPNFSKLSLLPPFGAVGLIAGKQHFITFDHRFYDFVGECSYLLASDFLDNKFSIVVNYNVADGDVVKKSLTVISEEHRIDISANYQVTVNGKKTELPATVGNAIVLSRSGDRLVVVSENNMAIECNLVHDICTVELTGWNFGKTGGLLGTFDYEPSNDLSLPNGTITTDLARFASSWVVGNNGRCLPVAQAPSPPANDDAIDACDVYFSDVESPLAACYGSVDPMPFYHMCISDMIRGADDGAVCTAAVAYVSQCRKAGVEAVFPPECVQCHLPNNLALSAGESKVLNGGAAMSADVVFVVEQALCVNGINLAKMATKLDAALIQQGLADNRFSVVGFGGETFHQPHTRTSKGEVWTSGRGIEKAFSGLVLGDGSDPRDEQGVYQALRFASELSFRGGVSKTIVLVQCSPCATQLDYADMMGLLLQSDITLHLLEPGAISLQSGSNKANSKVFGADLSGVYTARNGKNTKPNAGMLKQMILPKDHCSPLAFETNGTVFNLEQVSNSGKQIVAMKKFVDVWSRRVAQAARPSPCQKCDCVASQDGVGQVQCSTCVTASVDQFLLDWQSMLSQDYGRIVDSTGESIEEID